MKRSALLIVAAMAWALNGFPATQRPLIVTSQDHSFVDSDDCASFYTQSTTSLPSQVSSHEQRRVSLIGIDLLHVKTSNAGGVAVRGWDRPYARLTVCKYAAALTDPKAQRALQDVGVAIHAGEIIALGPEANSTQTWWVHMILRVPKTANVDVQAANGGIAVRNMSGRVTAQATNGGISLAACTGENRIETENGGISLEKIDHVNATTQNGPIAFRVREQSVPPQLEARTDDEIVCHLKVCTEGWSSDRKRLRIGSSAPQVHLMTNTAPILIEQVR
jgi:hypothetical protein